MIVRLTPLILLLAIGTSVGHALPPVEDFFRRPDVRDFDLSPNGEYVSAVTLWNDTYNIAVIHLESGEAQFLTDESVDVSYAYWLNDDWIQYRLGDGTAAEENWGFMWRTVAINVHTKQKKYIHPRIVGRRTAHPDEFYVLHRSNNRFYPHLRIYDIETKQERPYLLNPGFVSRYLFDEDGEPRVGVGLGNQFEIRLYARLTDDEDDWTEIDINRYGSVFVDSLSRTFAADIRANREVFGSSRRYMATDSRYLYMALDDEGETAAVYRLDLRTGLLDEEPLVSDATFDVVPSYLRHVRNGRIIGVSYATDTRRTVFWEENHESLHEIIAEALPGTISHLADWCDRGRIGVIRSLSDRDFPHHYLLDLRTLEMQSLGDPAPWTTTLPTVEQQSISYTNRDGYVIHGYLWLPEEWSPDTPVPFMLNPHGGPVARDHWGIASFYSMEPQFFASRGFGVLQMNFRGSLGFGKRHMAYLGDLEAMHNDIMDGLNWAVSAGYADADKVGIAGASWGGYAAMLALVKEPDAFQFGINFFGTVDLVESIRSEGRSRFDYAFRVWTDRLGDPRDDDVRHYLLEWSPLTHIERLRAPVFVYHGEWDYNVLPEQSEWLIEALDEMDHPHEYFLAEDEGHGVLGLETRLDLYRQIDAFIEPWAQEPDRDSVPEE